MSVHRLVALTGDRQQSSDEPRSGGGVPHGCVEQHPGPDIDTPDSWNEGLSELLVGWDDDTGSGVISLEAFLTASGLALAPGASVS